MWVCVPAASGQVGQHLVPRDGVVPHTHTAGVVDSVGQRCAGAFSRALAEQDLKTRKSGAYQLTLQ